MATITGTSGNNNVNNSNENPESSDLYDMLGGNDVVRAGGGNDTIFGGTGNDNLRGDAGNDVVYGDDGNDTVRGDAGNDILFGGAGNDLVQGGTGDDFLHGGAGADNIQGEAGNDTVSYEGSSGGVAVTINGSANTGGDAAGDTLSGIENLIGSSFADTLTGDALANLIDGGDGADVISAGDGNDTVIGGLGNDSIDGGTGADSITAGDGNDTVTGGLGNDTIFGGAGDDQITAGPDTATPVNLDFNWTLIGADETNLAGGVTQNTGGINVSTTYTQGFGGSTFSVESSNNPTGNDFDRPIYVAPGETFNPASSAELYRPGGQNASSPDTVLRVDFSAVTDSGFANTVENVRFRISDIDDGSFRDRVTVRAFDANGNEIPVNFTENSASLTVNGNTIEAADGTALLPDAPGGSVLIDIPGPVAYFTITYDNLETAQQAIRLSDIQFQAIPADNDFVAGGDGNDNIIGGIGNDTLDGGADSDTIHGGLGDDSLIGGSGDDQLFGDGGNDTIQGDTGNDRIEGGAGNDNLDGGAGDDTVLGDAGADVIDGKAGNDRLEGGADNDTLRGDVGNDLLFGGSGNDSISGGDDNDTIEGGTGADTLFGDAGNDVFVIRDGDVDTVGGTEFIYGGGQQGGPFEGDFDTIDLSEYGWSRIDIVYDLTSDPSGESGTITLYGPDGVTVVGTIVFTGIEAIIPCFTPGTLILTERGEVAVEALVVGDLVMTRDHGLQSLRWVGRRELSMLDLLADPDFQPIRIVQGAMDGTGPDRDMLVSPQHRVLVAGAAAQLLFGEDEVLVAAKHLLAKPGISRVLPTGGVSYVHILFDRHEIVQSDGIWTESFQPADRMLSAMDKAARDEVLALFPELATESRFFPAARLSLKAYEARVLLAA